MNVDFSGTELLADKVWYDANTARLCVLAGAFQNSIPLAQIPDGDFESIAPIARFTIGQSGTVVVCHHRDGAETWLPLDIWLPHGFTAEPRQ